MPKKKALVATGNSMLTIIHALLADPEARYHDLGADYYEQRNNARRQARSHVQSRRTAGCLPDTRSSPTWSAPHSTARPRGVPCLTWWIFAAPARYLPSSIRA